MDPYSPTVLQNVFSLVHQIFHCFYTLQHLNVKGIECSWEWLVNTDPDFVIFSLPNSARIFKNLSLDREQNDGLESQTQVFIY